MASFEESEHQGYSREEMAQEIEEKMARIDELGCPSCRYKLRGSYTCNNVISMSDRFKGKCPYYRQEENT